MESNRGYDVLVIGAGQAGLTVGYYLRQAGLRFLIVDGGRAGWLGVGRAVGVPRSVHPAPLEHDARTAVRR